MLRYRRMRSAAACPRCAAAPASSSVPRPAGPGADSGSSPEPSGARADINSSAGDSRPCFSRIRARKRSRSAGGTASRASRSRSSPEALRVRVPVGRGCGRRIRCAAGRYLCLRQEPATVPLPAVAEAVKGSWPTAPCGPRTARTTAPSAHHATSTLAGPSFRSCAAGTPRVHAATPSAAWARHCRRPRPWRRAGTRSAARAPAQTPRGRRGTGHSALRTSHSERV